MLPQIKVPEIHTPQWGIPGSSSPLGILTAGGNVIYLGTTVGNAIASDSNDGVYPTAPKATLTGAIAACTAGVGDVIVVLPGIYAFTTPAVLNKSSIRLLGWSYLLGPNVADTVFEGSGGSILDIQADYAEVAGIRFQSTNDATNYCINVGTGASYSWISIHDNLFRVGQYGINLGVGANTATGVKIYRNKFDMINNTAANAAINIVVGGMIEIYENVFWSNVALAVYGVGIANVAIPGSVIRNNEFIFQQAGTGIFRAGTTVDVSIHSNLFSGAGTPITVLVDGGDHAVNNYVASAAGGVLIDPTT